MNQSTVNRRHHDHQIHRQHRQGGTRRGPYSQATRTEQFVFASGQLPIDPVSGNIPDGIEQQTRQSLANLSAVLEAGGASFASVLKTTVFLKNMDDFAVMNGIYAEFFSDAAAGALDHRGRAPAEGRTGRSRSDRAAHERIMP